MAPRLPRAGVSSALLLATMLFWASAASAQPSYLLFESGPVRPVALSPDGERLFVANTPDGHLEIFDVEPSSGVLTAVATVPVGLEPVAVAARNDDEVWVVNHLSDSVSIVDVASTPPRVVRTLLVGDEPRDIVFAGSPQRAFVSTAHRGQHRTHGSISAVTGAGDPQLVSEGIGRADVWVFDAASPGSALGGVPIQIKSFFADTPRALATDGTTVYVAAFHSGNQTTAVNEVAVPDGFTNACGGGGEGIGVPGPSTNVGGDPAPETGVIVKFDGANWVDALGCTWSSAVDLALPDHDVFAMNANTLASGTVFDHVGTILFNMAINPVTGLLYVTNTESPNHVRFEGPGDFGGSTVQGRLSEARVSVLNPVGATVTPRHLNSHIDYSLLHTDPGANHALIDGQIPHSLATPLQVVVSDEEDPLVYIAAFGSAKVAVYDASDLEAGTFDPTVSSGDHIPTGGGPAGLALNATNDRLYVLTRFDQAISVFEVGGGAHTLLQRVRLPSPEPASVVEGRPLLYDAVATSGNGEASCASCHIFGDFDSLAWNLGNPDDVVTTDTQPMSTPFFENQPNFDDPDFHPMKGPMTTQTLRGLATHGGMHWRGDRVDGFFSAGGTSCGGSSFSNAPCDEETSFNNFIVAFEGLIGHDGTISSGDMQKFTDFALQLMLPPNPVANLDGSRTVAQQSGHDVYFSCGPGATECSFPFPDPDATDTVEDCDGCHDLDPALGFFGSGGEKSFENEPQNVKVAHLRNMYQKVGMFGLTGVTGFTGDQVRGFGYLHDGSVDTLKNFVGAGVFDLNATQEDQLEQLMLAFPSDLAPIVGQQVSIGPGSPDSCGGNDCAAVCAIGSTCQQVDERIDLLHQRAGAPFDSFVLDPGASVTECDLVVKTIEAGAPRSYLRGAAGTYQPDDGGSAISLASLVAKADASDAQDLHFQCVPPGSGQRVGLDRDEDSLLNEQDNCPAWPNGAALGTCTAGDAALLGSPCSSAAECGGGGFCSQAQEDGDGDGTGDACDPVLLPEPGAGLALALAAALLLALRRIRGAVARY